jgi:hypothetical protein
VALPLAVGGNGSKVCVEVLGTGEKTWGAEIGSETCFAKLPFSSFGGRLCSPPTFCLYHKLDPSLPDTGIGLSGPLTHTSGRPRVLAGPSGPASAMGGLEPATVSVTLQPQSRCPTKTDRDPATEIADRGRARPFDWGRCQCVSCAPDPCVLMGPLVQCSRFTGKKWYIPLFD